MPPSVFGNVSLEFEGSPWTALPKDRMCGVACRVHGRDRLMSVRAAYRLCGQLGGCIGWSVGCVNCLEGVWKVCWRTEGCVDSLESAWAACRVCKRPGWHAGGLKEVWEVWRARSQVGVKKGWWECDAQVQNREEDSIWFARWKHIFLRISY